MVMIKNNQQVSDLKDNETNDINGIKNAEEVYRKFLRLYDRFATDSLIVNKQGEILGKIIAELKAESSLATELKIQIRQDIAETMKETAEEINEQIKRSVQDSVTVGIGDSIKEFKSAVKSSASVLHENVNKKEPSQLWSAITLFFCVTSFVCIVYTTAVVGRHLPDSYFTGDQVATYKDGIFMDRLWRKLSKKEQERLIAIERGDLPPEEKSFVWIAKQNPGMSNEEIRRNQEKN